MGEDQSTWQGNNQKFPVTGKESSDLADMEREFEKVGDQVRIEPKWSFPKDHPKDVGILAHILLSG